MESDTTFPHFATIATHTGSEPARWGSKCTVPPISLGTTYQQQAPGVFEEHEYSRISNPSRSSLEACLAALEGGKHGITFSSGMAAVTMISHLLKAGDHLICMNDVYIGSNQFFSECVPSMNIETSFVDCTNLDNLAKAIRKNTKMVWIESPTNPTLRLVDIKKACDLVHQNSSAFVAIDNTFMSAYFQRPLDLGADITMHSLTKYMNGHSDVTMGAVITNDDALADRLHNLQKQLGAVPSPFDCYLVLRGLKTLHVRMKEHMKNGLLVARFLESNPRVESVRHPGLPSHPQYELGRKQLKGYSGMVTFYIKGGMAESTAFLKALNVIVLADSLGGTESLAELPIIMTHADLRQQAKDELGITDNMIRLSVGIEDINDLIEDLDQALQVAVE